MRVLVIEDKPEFRRLLCSHLRKHGFVVDQAETLDDASAAISTVNYDVVLLDLILPDGHGASLLQQLRRKNHKLGILVITALDGLAERINLLEGGADDYLVKPFDFEELIARVRAITRRRASSSEGAEQGLMFADVVVYPQQRFACVDGRNVTLGRHEAALLGTLLGRAGEPVSRDFLMSCVYDEPEEIGSNSLAVHVHHLRRKLAQAGAGIEIVPVRGLGYILQHRNTEIT